MSPRDEALIERMAQAIARARGILLGWANMAPTKTDRAYARAAYDAEHRVKR